MNIWLIIQTIISVLLIVTVMLQSQGGGLGSAFSSNTFYHTKRGIEKGLFVITIILAVSFTVVSLINLT